MTEVPAQEILREATGARYETMILGSHPRIQHLRSFVQNVASTRRVQVLLLGESGTGKNLVARAIHAESEDAAARFVEVNCAALPANLLEAELFGYEKGAFTDARQAKQGLAEVAEGGTLFLDEVGTLPLELQAKLLSFLESRTFRRVGGTQERTSDARIIAATNADLAGRGAGGPLPGGPVLSPQRRAVRAAALREIRERHPGARRALHRQGRRVLPAAGGPHPGRGRARSA